MPLYASVTNEATVQRAVEGAELGEDVGAALVEGAGVGGADGACQRVQAGVQVREAGDLRTGEFPVLIEWSDDRKGIAG